MALWELEMIFYKQLHMEMCWRRDIGKVGALAPGVLNDVVVSRKECGS